MTGPWPEQVIRDAAEWIAGALDAEDVSRVIPADDPLRTWWDPHRGGGVRSLLDVVIGAGDALTFVALVQRARTRSAGRQPPPALEAFVAELLQDAALRYRSRSYPAGYHAFLSYSHRDMARVTMLVDILGEHGIRFFQDVRDIPAGASIVGALDAAMAHARKAVLVVTEEYAKSHWTSLELEYLDRRRRQGSLTLLPVLLDNVGLPELLQDTFTIDLRGFGSTSDRVWAKAQLQKLIDVCLLE